MTEQDQTRHRKPPGHNKTSAGKHPEGQRRAGKRPAGKTGKPGKRRPESAQPGSADRIRKVADKHKPAAAAKPAGPIRLAAPLILAMAGLLLGLTGLSVLDQLLSVVITHGRAGVVDTAWWLTGLLAGASLGLIVAQLLTSNMRTSVNLLATLILVAGSGAAGAYGLPIMANNLVMQSTPIQRQQALKAEFVNQTAVAGAFQADGLPAERNKPETQTLIAGLGLFGVLDPQVYSRINSSIDRVAASVMARGLTEESAWKRFQESVAQIQRDYARYQDASAKYQTVISNLDGRADELWQSVVTTEQQLWHDYEQRVKTAHSQLAERIPELHDLLNVYFRHKINHRDTEELERRYQELSTDLFGAVVDAQIWCGNSGCPGTEDFLEQTGARVLSTKFAELNDGIPLDLDETAFIAQPATINNIRKQIEEQGIRLPADWRLDVRGHDSLLIAAIRDLPYAATARFQASMRDWFDAEIEPGLGYPDFIARDAVQDQLRKSLGLPKDLRIDPSIDQTSFVRDYFPRIKRRPVDALAGDMQAPLEDFENQARLASAGRQALREISILPLCLFASGIAAMVGLLTTLTMAVLLLGRIILKLLAQGQAAAGLARVIGILWLTGLLGILAGPMIAGSGLAGLPGYANIASAGAQAPLLGTITDWSMRTAPVLQPLGQKVHHLLFRDNSFGIEPLQLQDQDEYGLILSTEAAPADPTGGNGGGLTGIRNTLDKLIKKDPSKGN